MSEAIDELKIGKADFYNLLAKANREGIHIDKYNPPRSLYVLRNFPTNLQPGQLTPKAFKSLLTVIGLTRWTVEYMEKLPLIIQFYQYLYDPQKFEEPDLNE